MSPQRSPRKVTSASRYCHFLCPVVCNSAWITHGVMERTNYTDRKDYERGLIYMALGKCSFLIGKIFPDEVCCGPQHPFLWSVINVIETLPQSEFCSNCASVNHWYIRKRGICCLYLPIAWNFNKIFQFLECSNNWPSVWFFFASGLRV